MIGGLQLKEGKNFKLTNEWGIHYDLVNPNLGADFPIRIYGGYDLLVDGEITVSPEEYWIVMNDLDGQPYAQPMNAQILASKLMSGGLVPIKK